MNIHHVGYLVKKLDKARASFEALGYIAEGEVAYDEIRDIDILFMINGDYRIELVMPKSENSVVNDLLKKNGSGPYHICYHCEDIEASMEEMRSKGFVPAGDIQPAPAIDGRRVVFMFSRTMGIIELVED